VSRLAECRGCRAPIVWVVMRESGRPMPCDPDLVEAWIDETAGKAATTLALVTEDGAMRIGRPLSDMPADGAPTAERVTGRVPHWGTCPDRARFKRDGR
jgi:hypothetical protein